MVLQEAGRVVIIVGVVLVVFGSILWFFGKLPFLGKLPGDILIKRENFSFYLPITTTILISLILSFVFTLVSNIRK